MLWALGTVREGVIAEEGGKAERCGNSVECLACFGNEKKEETLFLLFFADRTRLELATPCVTGMYSNQTELPIRLSFDGAKIHFFLKCMLSQKIFFIQIIWLIFNMIYSKPPFWEGSRGSKVLRKIGKNRLNLA